jgi:hypothetical protein
MSGLDLETIQMLDAVHRASRPKLDERQALDELTEAMARLLHYQDTGEPDWNSPAETLIKECTELPKPIRDRYMNDAKFHAQVTRAVSAILDINNRTLRRSV